VTIVLAVNICLSGGIIKWVRGEGKRQYREPARLKGNKRGKRKKEPAWTTLAQAKSRPRTGVVLWLVIVEGPLGSRWGNLGSTWESGI